MTISESIEDVWAKFKKEKPSIVLSIEETKQAIERINTPITSIEKPITPIEPVIEPTTDQIKNAWTTITIAVSLKEQLKTMKNPGQSWTNFLKEKIL